MSGGARIDPRLRVVYVLAVGVGIFFLRRPLYVGGLLALHAVLWLIVGLPPRRLFRHVVKLWAFAAFIVASYALTSEDPSVDRWTTYAVLGWNVPVNLGGAVVGATMVLRVLTVVLASQ